GCRAEEDREALGSAGEVVASLSVRRTGEAAWIAGRARNDKAQAEELLTLMPTNLREPVDMREVMVRLVDDGDLLEFKPLYGAATVFAQVRIGVRGVGCVSNNGPIDVDGAIKPPHLFQCIC